MLMKYVILSYMYITWRHCVNLMFPTMTLLLVTVLGLIFNNFELSDFIFNLEILDVWHNIKVN